MMKGEDYSTLKIFNPKHFRHKNHSIQKKNSKIIFNTVSTHNKHIFVRPKKVYLLWEMCLFWEIMLRAIYFSEIRLFLTFPKISTPFCPSENVLILGKYALGYLFFRKPPLLKISTFWVGKKECAYYEKCAFYG